MKAMRRGTVKKTVYREFMKEKRNLVIRLCKIMNSTEQARQVFLFLLYCR